MNLYQFNVLESSHPDGQLDSFLIIAPSPERASTIARETTSMLLGEPVQVSMDEEKWFAVQCCWPI